MGYSPWGRTELDTPEQVHFLSPFQSVGTLQQREISEVRVKEAGGGPQSTQCPGGGCAV